MAKQVPTRVCPTRVDHSPALFAHVVSEGHCQQRQRALYHKCFTCAFNNDNVSANGLPVTPRVRMKQVAEETAGIPLVPDTSDTHGKAV